MPPHRILKLTVDSSLVTDLFKQSGLSDTKVETNLVGVDDANISWLVLWHSVFHLAALAPPHTQPLQEHYIKLYDHIFHGDKPALEIARRSHLAKAAIQLGIAVEWKVGETRREVPSVILCIF